MLTRLEVCERLEQLIDEIGDDTEEMTAICGALAVAGSVIATESEDSFMLYALPFYSALKILTSGGTSWKSN